MARGTRESKHPVLPPLERAPCANVEPKEKRGCPKAGKSVCSKCQLVRYCSKECQTKHWSQHKLDCNHPIRSEDWAPAWVVKNRAFRPEDDNPDDKDVEALWGRVPAVDLLKLSENEGCSNQNLDLACFFSCDLRNIVRTINELPDDYSGQINFLLNDEPIVVARNIVLLVILALSPDKAKAVEHAVHVWYSSFVPMDCEIEIKSMWTAFSSAFRNEGTNTYFNTPISDTSTISGRVTQDVVEQLRKVLRVKHDRAKAQVEWNRTVYATSESDMHHANYCRLEPSHRLALLNYRKTGLVLPFGARRDHFDWPNRFLFSPEAKWVEDEAVNPLLSWDIPKVIQAGKAHGTQRADLYGCLYFYLFSELRIFAERLCRFRVNFRIFSEDAGILSKNIRNNTLVSYGVPASIVFDRIDIANLFDVSAISNTLTDWAPFLKDNKHATLMCHSLDWVRLQGEERPEPLEPSMDEGVIAGLTAKMIKDGRIPRPSDPTSVAEVTRIAGLTVGYEIIALAIWDTSAAFRQFLSSHGMTKGLLRRTGIRCKEKHTIIPHRLCAPLGNYSDALPSFLDKEDWYLNVCVTNHTWAERFLEFGRR